MSYVEGASTVTGNSTPPSVRNGLPSVPATAYVMVETKVYAAPAVKNACGI
jgi:hypothetical protein